MCQIFTPVPTRPYFRHDTVKETFAEAHVTPGAGCGRDTVTMKYPHNKTLVSMPFQHSCIGNLLSLLANWTILTFPLDCVGIQQAFVWLLGLTVLISSCGLWRFLIVVGWTVVLLLLLVILLPGSRDGAQGQQRWGPWGGATLYNMVLCKNPLRSATGSSHQLLCVSAVRFTHTLALKFTLQCFIAR